MHILLLAFILHIVKAGETLSGIVGNRWPVVCQINHIRDCNLIYPGEKIYIPESYRHTVSVPVVADRHERYSGTLGCQGLEGLWESAGGNAGSAFLAAEIAMAESGGRQYATGPAGERGYWQINPVNGAFSTYDAYGNARAAVVISDNGRNWTPWTTYVHGLYVGRCLCGLRNLLRHSLVLSLPSSAR
jgi:hypothetical protein